MNGFVVIDIGCHECGVDSLLVGWYSTAEEAEAARLMRDESTGCWRDNGQTFAQVFDLSEPAGTAETIVIQPTAAPLRAVSS